MRVPVIKRGAPPGSFYVYRAAAYSLINGTPVPFDARLFDPSGCVDIATGRFYPKVAGLYSLSTEFGVPSGQLAVDNFMGALIYKNGNQRGIGTRSFQRSAGEGLYLAGHVIIDAVPGDYFQAVPNIGSGGTPSMIVGVNQNYFSGHRVGD